MAEAVFKLQLATDEAFTNIVEHAYGGQSPQDHVELFCGSEGGFFIIELRDHGRGFDPSEMPAHPPTNLDNPQIGGLGLHFMHQIMDDLQHSFDSIHGNVLTMRKKLPQATSSG